MSKKKRGSQSGDNDRTQGTSDPSVSCGFRHVVLFGCVLWIYVCTVFPSITGGDAGELLAESCQFGIPHPPGDRRQTVSRMSRCTYLLYRYLILILTLDV